MVLVFWHLNEPEEDRHTYEPYMSICEWAKQNGKRMLGHAVFYGWDGLDDCDPEDRQLNFIQQWVRSLSRDDLERAMRQHMESCFEHFGPYIDDFVLNNEILGKYGTDPQDWFSRKLGFRSLTPYFRWAHAIAPKKRFYLNENSILAGPNTPKYCELIRSLLDEGAPVGGIGIQSHFFGERVPNADEMWQKLDSLAAFGLPIRISEFGVKSVDEALHVEDMLRLLNVCFAHPAVVGVNFWNFWEPDMWPGSEPKREAHLRNRDGSGSSAAQAFVDLIPRQWTTQAEGTIDDDGLFRFRGFYGQYELTAAGQPYEITLLQGGDASTAQIA